MGSFDNNATLGPLAVEGFRKEYNDEANVFSAAIWKYALKIANQDSGPAADSAPVELKPVQGIKTPPSLCVSSAGFPLLPELCPGESLSHKKDLLRAFLNTSYGEFDFYSICPLYRLL